MFKLMLAKSDAEYASLQDEFIKGLDKYNTDEIYKYWYDKVKQQQVELQPVYDLLNSK